MVRPRLEIRYVNTYRALAQPYKLPSIVAGIGIGYYIAHVLRRSRLLVRLRVGWFWWNSEDNDTSPTNKDLLAIKAKSLGNGASIRTIVSPTMTQTADMNTALLTLGPGTELTKTKSHGVEFYFVIQGTCTLSIQDQDDEILAKGEFKVVNPWV